MIDKTNGELISQMKAYTRTLQGHFHILNELNGCINFIKTRTEKLKELRNFIRRQSTSLDQIFPYFFTSIEKLQEPTPTVNKEGQNQQSN